MEPHVAGRLFAEFPEVSDAEWRRAAEEALEGAPFEKKLVTRTPEGIALQPIYTRRDAETWSGGGEWPGLPPFTRGAEPLGARAHGWWIAQEISAATPAEFNGAILEALPRGQNAVALTPEQCWADEASLATAWAGVDLAAVPLLARAEDRLDEFAPAFFAHVRTARLPLKALHGGILADPIAAWLRHGGLTRPWDDALGAMAEITADIAHAHSPLRTIGLDASLWTDAGADAAQELGFALASGVEYLRALDARGLGVDVAGPRVLATFGLGSHFFLQIAKLRAARWLWARAIRAAGGGADAQRLRCHARTTRWNKSTLDPHVNLLRATSEAFAGIAGGATGLHVEPFDALPGPPSALGERLARNLQIILAEECQLGRVVDPAGGSWFVETLTRQLAEKAWEVFQDIEARGGMAAAIRAGYPQARVAEAARARLEAVETRREGLIGVNLHPNPREEVRAPVPRPGIAPRERVEPVEALPARRRADPFEELRRRVAAGAARTGARPKVFLAQFGPRKQHAARAEFSSGFFAAGGFEIAPGPAFEAIEPAAAAARASGAPIVVLCSTDETYPELAPAFARALKAGPAAPLVVLAGLPATPELQAQFRAAGVDEFIHLRANCARLLAGFLDRLGL
jgi:methylmalonyl-CoA mutase